MFGVLGRLRKFIKPKVFSLLSGLKSKVHAPHNPQLKNRQCILALIVAVTLQQGGTTQRSVKAKRGTKPLFIVQNCASQIRANFKTNSIYKG